MPRATSAVCGWVVGGVLSLGPEKTRSGSHEERARACLCGLGFLTHAQMRVAGGHRGKMSRSDRSLVLSAQPSG